MKPKGKLEVVLEPTCSFGICSNIASKIKEETGKNVFYKERKGERGTIEGRSIFIDTDLISPEIRRQIIQLKGVRGILEVDFIPS